MTALEQIQQDLAEFTKQYGLKGEILHNDSQILCVLRVVPTPNGKFTHPSTNILFQTDRNYPLSAMDMFWTDKDLVLADGSNPTNAEALTDFPDTGKQWRQFSYHRPAGQSWDPSRNGIEQQYLVVLKRWEADR